MKIIGFVFGLAALGGAVWSGQSTTVVVLTGDLDGNLSPCGCTKPMTGGILRRATAIRQLGGSSAIILDNGGMASDGSRQSTLKVEALAEAARKLGATAINLSPSESRLGPGLALTINTLSKGKLVASQLPADNRLGIKKFVQSGPFLIGGVQGGSDGLVQMGEEYRSADFAVAELENEAASMGLLPALMLSGTKEEATSLAEKHPGLAFIQYRTSGGASLAPDRVGQTLLVTVGSGGKQIVRMEWRGNKMVQYRAIELSPAFADDPKTKITYLDYLGRVRQEGLLDQLPRKAGPAFAGNDSCSSCHAKAAKVWRASEHKMALATLEKVGHDFDPDCVKCHVVGLDSEAGFRSKKLTPNLSDVGCEACHGAGMDHAKNPKVVHMPPAGEKACMTCHNVDHSPGFSFKEAWLRIQH